MVTRAESDGARPVLRVLVAAGLLLAPAGQPVRSQVQAAVPVEREPAHHPVFENGSVGVLEVRFPPGYVSLWHTHSTDNVTVRIQTGLTRVDRPDQNGTPETAAVGRVVFNSAEPPYTHRVNNLGPTEIFTFDVEILAPSPVRLSASAPDDMAQHDVVVDNARVRASRLRLSPGGVLPAHTHRRGWLEVDVTGARAGTYTWHEAGAPVTFRAADATEIVEIEPR